MKLLSVTAAVLIASGSAALAKECRIPDVPGARIQLPPECRDQVRNGRLEAKRQDAIKADKGFVDLGNGTQVRIGGRVRVEGAVRR